MESLIFVDSNIWCYYFDRSAQEHNEALICRPNSLRLINKMLLASKQNVYSL